MPQRIPKVAQVEDYDSDESSVKPGTRKEARKRAPAPPPPKALSRYKTTHIDGASDSGYSSRASGTQASKASANVQTAGPVQPPPRPATSHGQIKAKPVVSQPSRPRAPSRSASTSRRSSEQCDDPHCRHSICLAVRYPERRSSISQQQVPQYAPQYASSPSTYPQVPQYQYAQVSQSQSSQTVPTLSSFPQPRLRSGSTSRQARPMSIHGYPFQPPSGTSTPGPPPSASAYQNIDYQNMDPQWVQWYQQAMLLRQQQAYQLQQQQQQQQQAAAYAAATNQSQAYAMQTQPSPLQTSPTSPKFGRSARLQQAYSARVATPMSASGTSTPNYFPSGLGRTPSTRLASARAYKVPGQFPGDDTSSSETESSSENSSSDLSEDEYERERRARPRDSRLMSSSSQRRPSMSKPYRTEPAVPTTNSLAREILTRNPRSDHVLDYVSSDNMDSDKTTRAIVDRPRTTYTDSTRSSRRPSLSTTASSGRTRATTMSSATSGMASMTMESRSGRRISYLSERDQAKYARKQEEERRRIENIEAYQDSMRGGKVPELTAEKLKMAQMHSSGHGYAQSRKSSRASSRAAHNPGDGVKIENGGTTIHVYGNQSIEMIPSRDGGTASLVIGSRSARDSTYFGDSSKSSGSRAGKSRVGSDVGARREQVIQEEFGGEQATV